MQKSKKMRMGISFLLSFFLAAALFLLYEAAVVKTGFLPGNAWKVYLMGSGYGSKMSEEAEKKMAELLEGYGLPAGAAGDLIKQETLYAEYSRLLEASWQDETQALQQREAFEKQLEKQIIGYLEKQQVNLTEQLEREIQAMAAEAGGIYESCLNPLWLQKMQNLGKEYQGMLTIAIAFGIFIAALCMLLLWKLYHFKHKALRFVCFAMEASLAWSALSLFFLGQKDWLAQSGIAPLAYQELIGGLTDIGTRNGLLALGVEGWLLIMLLIWMKRLKHSIR